MTKHEKRIGVPSPATKRRIDPPAPSTAKVKRKRRVFPPHWGVTSMWVGTSGKAHFFFRPSPLLDGFGYDVFPRGFPPGLTERLAHLAAVFPETAGWPVRFISGGEHECGREVIR
jgi:hypothetical protein